MLSINDKIKKVLNDLGLILAGSLTTILLLIFILFIVDYTIAEDTVASFKYSNKINAYRQDNYVNTVSDLCKMADGDYKQIECVYDFYSNLYNGESQESFNSIEYSLTNSTDCKNSVMFYCSVLRNMNFSCKANFVKNHTYAVVDLGGDYCILDQTHIYCN